MTLDRLDRLGQVGDLLADMTAALVRRTVSLDPHRWAPAPGGIALAEAGEGRAVWTVTVPSGRALLLAAGERRERVVLSAQAADLWLSLARDLSEGARALVQIAARNAGLALVDVDGRPADDGGPYGEAYALSLRACVWQAAGGAVRVEVAGPLLGVRWPAAPQGVRP